MFCLPLCIVLAVSRSHLCVPVVMMSFNVSSNLLMTRNIANIAATTTKAGLKFRAYNLDKMPHQPLKQLLILLTRVNVLIIRVLALRRGNKAIT